MHTWSAKNGLFVRFFSRGTLNHTRRRRENSGNRPRYALLCPFRRKDWARRWNRRNNCRGRGNIRRIPLHKTLRKALRFSYIFLTWHFQKNTQNTNRLFSKVAIILDYINTIFTAFSALTLFLSKCKVYNEPYHTNNNNCNNNYSLMFFRVFFFHWPLLFIFFFFIIRQKKNWSPM